MRRFWTTVSVVPVGDEFEVRLDDRPLRTPAKAPCLMPSRALAEAAAAEWEIQREVIDPAGMPLTRAANTAIDRVAREFEAVAATVAAYGASDLVCYRAPYPEGLVQRQSEVWDPPLAWAREALGARLVLAEGVMHVAQPPESLERLGAEVRAHGPWELTALHDLVTISGSLVIGLAVSRGRLAPPEAWAASRIDEDWNIAEWGEDAEAAGAAERRRESFLEAARFLDLVRG